eukprot:TRINITY_DN4710_c0_g1_i1.p1 TRINITY_DN4710_c0_g1~~TRINITY_DN4710_c0_g1_i1.p1  ORF type:complete len:750 (+),score=139.24 TRINITY_DN4710_c0_g1_i1:74-2323(+)
MAGSRKKSSHQLRSRSSSYLIFIKSLTGRTIQISVSPNDTIFDVKFKIMDKESIPVEAINLIYAGKMLQDDLTIENYEIGKEAILHLVTKIVPNKPEPEPEPWRAVYETTQVTKRDRIRKILTPYFLIVWTSFVSPFRIVKDYLRDILLSLLNIYTNRILDPICDYILIPLIDGLSKLIESIDSYIGKPTIDGIKYIYNKLASLLNNVCTLGKKVLSPLKDIAQYLYNRIDVYRKLVSILEKISELVMNTLKIVRDGIKFMYRNVCIRCIGDPLKKLVNLLLDSLESGFKFLFNLIKPVVQKLYELTNNFFTTTYNGLVNLGENCISAVSYVYNDVLYFGEKLSFGARWAYNHSYNGTSFVYRKTKNGVKLVYDYGSVPFKFAGRNIKSASNATWNFSKSYIFSPTWRFTKVYFLDTGKGSIKYVAEKVKSFSNGTLRVSKDYLLSPLWNLTKRTSNYGYSKSKHALQWQYNLYMDYLFRPLNEHFLYPIYSKTRVLLIDPFYNKMKAIVTYPYRKFMEFYSNLDAPQGFNSGPYYVAIDPSRMLSYEGNNFALLADNTQYEILIANTSQNRCNCYLTMDANDETTEIGVYRMNPNSNYIIDCFADVRRNFLFQVNQEYADEYQNIRTINTVKYEGKACIIKARFIPEKIYDDLPNVLEDIDEVHSHGMNISSAPLDDREIDTGVKELSNNDDIVFDDEVDDEDLNIVPGSTVYGAYSTQNLYVTQGHMEEDDINYEDVCIYLFGEVEL